MPRTRADRGGSERIVPPRSGGTGRTSRSSAGPGRTCLRAPRRPDGPSPSRGSPGSVPPPPPSCCVRTARRSRARSSGGRSRTRPCSWRGRRSSPVGSVANCVRWTAPRRQGRKPPGSRPAQPPGRAPGPSRGPCHIPSRFSKPPGSDADRSWQSAGGSARYGAFMADDPKAAGTAPSDFIRDIVASDLRSGKHHHVVTRFPPEPNGYLHIGHAKSICLNFGIAQEFGGVCHLRFDDTNPLKEDVEYVDSIQEDIRWLGFDWGANLFYASDYFERLYEFGELLIRDGKAYVDSLSADEIRTHRGTLTEPGRPSPYRERPADESLDLFRRMRAGEFADGAHVLRARIDMASPNLNMRDPILYRIRRASHHRTGDAWCIYPMYDFAHPLSDAIEGITHSICTLEFEDHRPLYDWLIEHCRTEAVPHQYEFARLNLN